MKVNRLSIFGLVLATLTIYAACRKMDYQSSKEKEKINPEERFFNLHKATNPVVNTLSTFMKRENDRLHFVEQTVTQIGFPYWDKAMVTKVPSQARTGRSASDSVLFCFVPFVRDTQNYVNSFLELRVQDRDTAYRYLCDWQYREMEYGSYSADSTAEYFAMFFMYFDNEMFGHEQFNILDTALFNYAPSASQTNARITILPATSFYGRGSNYYVGQVCVPAVYCPVPTSPQCSGPGGCDFLNCSESPPLCFLYTSCTNLFIYGGGGGWQQGNGNGNGNSGGGGGNGNGTPPPCVPNIQRGTAANQNCLPGWQPIPPPPPPPPAPDTLLNPCDFAFLLGDDPIFRNMLQDLKNHSDNPNDTSEHVVVYTANASSYLIDTFSGPPGQRGVNFDLLIPVDGVGHNHFANSLSIFSPDDLWSISYIFNNRLMIDSSLFTYPLVTAQGTQYLLMIENLTKFRPWARKLTQGNFNLFKLAYDKTLKIKISNSASVNERNFLRFLKANGGSGLKLFRGNTTFTEWVPLGLDASNNVITAPCL